MIEHEIEQQSPPSPEQFLAEVAAADPGWSEKHGGPMGVVGLCGALQQRISEQSEAIAAVRVAAILELLKEYSGVELAAAFGVSKAAISKATKANVWRDAQW